MAAKKAAQAEPERRGRIARFIEFVCNLSLFYLPVPLLVYSGFRWLKTGDFHWATLAGWLKRLRLDAPEKLDTDWAGINIIYNYALNAPLAMVSISFGLLLLAIGALLSFLRRI